jgi:hypothetical protein
MRFCQLTYASTIGYDLSLAEAQRIAQRAASKNQSLGVTGLLLLSPKHFVQVLEGPTDTVNHLYLRVGQDPRHERVVLLHYQHVVRRQYPDWAMGLVPMLESDWSALASAHSPQGEFSPYQMDSLAVQTLFARARTRAALEPRTSEAQATS